MSELEEGQQTDGMDRDGEAGEMDEWKGDFEHTYPAGSS